VGLNAVRQSSFSEIFPRTKQRLEKVSALFSVLKKDVISRAKFGKNRNEVILWANGRSIKEAEDGTGLLEMVVVNTRRISLAVLAQYRKAWWDMCRRSI
jgi:hypothetical protein